MRRVLTVLVLAVLASPAAWAGDGIDLNLWHEQLALDLGEETEVEPVRPSLGIYPTLGAALGPPNWASLQAAASIGYSCRSFSIYGGYGVERGPNADAHIITVGWGGVRAIPVASKQKGFHGKYLRYRRWDQEDHGIHHGLSFGTEHGIGFAGISTEIGAARSERNHWIVTLQVALKFAAPIQIPLSKPKDE